MMIATAASTLSAAHVAALVFAIVAVILAVKAVAGARNGFQPEAGFAAVLLGFIALLLWVLTQ